ncbi:TIM barrel protein [Clostridium sp.]|jgi:sugar phosphate isomerase/epimerase|uniref:sugar phosphate isomerase/epimerase family protein n=1 Tax=Clostridium sp. TaxID=1506 RepID=UPI00307B1654
MKKLWKGMFMTPHLWESIYMAHRAGYDGCGAMILPRGGKGPLHELLAEPGLWSRVQTALDETGLFLDGIGNCIIDDPANVHPYGMGMPPEPDDLRDYFEFAGKHELGGVQTSVWTTNQDLAVERFDHLCAVCGEYGLTVNLEFVAWGICDDLQKAKDLLKMVGRSNARITLDIMHLYYSSVTPEEIAACPPELFGEFHLCDVPHITFPDGHRELAAEGRSYRLWPGESGLDLTKWLEVIPDTAVIMPEIPNQDRNALYGQFEYNCRTLEECKRYYRAHGISL